MHNATPASSAEIERLQNTVAELTTALGVIGGLFGGILVGAGLVGQNELADRMEFDAHEAGRKLAQQLGASATERPNGPVMHVAAAVRQIGQPLRVIGGTEASDD